MKNYPNLKFLGLALTNANSFDIFNKKLNIGDQSHMSSSETSPLHSLLNLSEKNLATLWDIDDQCSIKLQECRNTNQSNKQSKLVVTGESNESQLIASLKQYKTRNIYVQKALYHLFILSRNFQETKIELLELIGELMQIHSKSQGVQLAATTCIFNLTRMNMYTNIPSSVLSQIINSILSTMVNYPNTIIVCFFIYFKIYFLNLMLMMI